ncbi:VWA domain-containing protein [Phytoactinopolyspora mesophila]|uniref:VWA domain-containing protein n=1 Tax=Phytoactinopolyspora mesophila TaxID=2650750 RepID=A0A7K3M6S1_9ACTN|nr:VWA domain-containing protein [Phytoactinopolyspora mesophila]NDL59013.1 VWA domain-containing protein [Phytoactinopolyspora mesophila]
MPDAGDAQGPGLPAAHMLDAAPRLDAAQRAVVRAWLAGGRFGLLLTGDGWLRERLWWWIRDQLDGHPHVVVGPGTDSAALHGGPRWPGEVLPPRGLLARAREGALLVPTPELCEPATLAALARAPRILASVPLIADVPHVVARRLTAVVHLEPGVPGEAAAVEGSGLPAGDDVCVGLASEVVEILDDYGLADHGLELDATRLAASVAAAGADPREVIRRCVCEPRMADVVVPSAPQPPAADQPPTSDDDPTTSDDDPAPPDNAAADSTNRETMAEGEVEAGGPDRPEEPEPLVGGSPPLPQPRRVARRRPARRYLEGRRGAVQQNPLRGRPRRVVPVDRTGGRVAVVPTIQAAAPWQVVRRGAAGEGRLVIRPEDLRGQVRHRRGGRVVLVVVDASGSMARRAIRRAKAHALHVLDQAYRERALVGIVVVRGDEASVGLPLTRSTTRARASLRALPTGGGTPLASGLILAATLAGRYEAEQVETVIFTDGRANVGLGGDPRADAEHAARLLGVASGEVRVVDPAPGRRNAVNWLSEQFAG